MKMQFNRLTLSAACDILKAKFSTNAQWEKLFLEWGIEDEVSGGSLEKNALALFSYAARNPEKEVFTKLGDISLHQAIVEAALVDLEFDAGDEAVKELEVGLTKDGFCLDKVVQTEENLWGEDKVSYTASLKRMYPAMQQLSLPIAESEVFSLMSRLGFSVHSGHLQQAIDNFTQGNWAAANSQLRTSFEGLLDTVAERLGADESMNSKAKRDYLGKTLAPPFLSKDLNEWLGQNSNPQFVQGLLSRLHPAGSHLGLSEEDDAAFRLHVVLITTRLFLRRFSQWGD